ncbi:MAG: DUF1700 domain-containing protein [Firmicutes bacterium]|nr:DUF1700 domain-containing protein [Bacillota bacterium]
MTKYEWERELKNNLKRVPEAEVGRILDYYNELFADKAEEGLSEKEIIRKFGNPFDVAYKILYDYRGGTGSNEEASQPPYGASAPFLEDAAPLESPYANPAAPPAYAPSPSVSAAYPPPAPRTAAAYAPPTPVVPDSAPAKTRKGRGGVIAAKIIFFLPYAIIMIVMWSLVVSFFAAGFGSVVGGVFYAFFSLSLLDYSIGASAATCGAGIAAFGVGCLMSVGAYLFFKTAKKLTQKYFYMGKHRR